VHVPILLEWGASGKTALVNFVLARKESIFVAVARACHCRQAAGLGMELIPCPYTGTVASTGTEVSILRFGVFELDVPSGELRRGGVLIRLSPQQWRLLRFLAEHPGQVCTRDQIQREIWGSEVFVDFDRGLNVCIAQIRAALNDDSEAPRFIQTVPRRGYRFLAPVEQVTPASAIALPQPARQSEWRRPALRSSLALLCVGLAAAAWSVWSPPRRTMLAVLPFENLTRHAEDGPMIDGLADELITQFGTVDPARLGVIGRTSVMRYGSGRPSLAAAGRELGVDYVVEGGFRHESGRTRISVRMAKAADQAQVWSETYEQDAAGHLEMQEEIAARVSVAVAGRLLGRSPPVAPRAHVPQAAAGEAFLNGRYLERKNTRADAERAIAFYEQAGNRDPAFAEPWAAMAVTYIGLAMSGRASGSDVFPKARAAAEHALLVAESAEAHTAMADVCFWYDWNWNQARSHFERAIALNPSLARAHHDYAFYLVAMGRTEAGLASLRRAIAIDPLSPHVNLDAGWLLLQAHHFDEAIRQAKRALELEPGLSEANACIGRAQSYQGKSEAAPLYRQMAETGKDEYYRALAFAMLGQKDNALRELEAAYQTHSTMMPLLGTEPAFAGLHGDARFREISRKVGLTLAIRP
jgi:TolB-like protein/DNA-binding winged helix-turn-helix (wHTH) protein/Tfp pilus assembly protein PilF